RDSLDKAGVLNQGRGSGAPGDGEEVKRNNSAQQKYGEFLNPIVEHDGEDKRQDAHHHNRIQEGPEDTQGHVPVTEFEILEDQVGTKKDVIAAPHFANFNSSSYGKTRFGTEAVL
ncbi:MAG: hypothetical protein ABSH09_35245, partial [Bryobacteraceae bacterium]